MLEKRNRRSIGIDRTSTAAKVADHLRERIASGALNPGHRITELEVCSELEVSRSPVREALFALAREGLVTLIPYKGAIVSELDRERFEDLLRFRVVLEEFAVGRAIEVASERDLQKLEKIIPKIRKNGEAGNLAGAVEADLQSHETIIALAQSPLLLATYTGMLNQLRLYIRLTSNYYEHVEDLAREHEELLDAIKRRDIARAKTLLRDHIHHGYEDAVGELDKHSFNPIA